MTMPPPEVPTPTKLGPEELTAIRAAERRQRIIITAIAAAVVIIVAFLIAGIYWLIQPATPTDRIRDIFIIVAALESLLIGFALIVLIVQLASLINLIQNEMRPILNATSETINTLRGTAEFLGENVVEPVIELKGYLAGLNRMLELMGIKRK